MNLLSALQALLVVMPVHHQPSSAFVVVSPSPSRRRGVTRSHRNRIECQQRLQQQDKATLLFSFAGEDGDNDDSFMKDLRSRMEEVSDRSTKLPIIVLDSILPRQLLKVEVADDPKFMDLIRGLIAEDRPYFGMVGIAQLNTGQTLPLQNGCQVEIVGKPQVVDDTGGGALRMELRATRRFRIQGEITQHEKGWAEARVKFFDSEEEQEQEIQNSDDPASLARAKSHARELTSPNFTMGDGNASSLIDRWIALARENEQTPGQIDQLLKDLGERPSPDQPTELAFWVGALINPLPGMHVAMEIRPSLLMSQKAEERVLVALKGITESIKHMDGTKRLF